MQKRLLLFALLVFVVGCASSEELEDVEPTVIDSEVNNVESNMPAGDSGVDEMIVKLDTKDCSNFYFEEFLVDPDQVQIASPLGSVHGSGQLIVGRSYVQIDPDLDSVDLFAPTDMVLIAGGVDDPIYLERDGFVDFTLVFDVGCGVTMALDHVKTVVPKIEEILPVMIQGEGWPKVDSIFIAKGEKIGSWVSGEGTPGFDFIVEDEKIINKFPTQARYEGSNLLHIMCPFDMYRGDMKQAYYDKLTVKNDCKGVARDIPGALEGQWFLEEEPSEVMHEWHAEEGYGSPFPIINDDERLTIGKIGGRDKIWVYPNYPSYKDPKEVTAEHCYAIHTTPTANDGYVFFKMLGLHEMEVVYAETGECPDNFPDEGIKYYR